jgi:hypothetical protein
VKRGVDHSPESTFLWFRLLVQFRILFYYFYYLLRVYEKIGLFVGWPCVAFCDPSYVFKVGAVGWRKFCL